MDELISRQQAIDALDKRFDSIPIEQTSEILLLRKDLRELPIVKPERLKGKWLSHYDYCKKHGYTPSKVIALWWCDKCEQGVEHPTNFCPNCGSYNGGKINDQ